MGPVLPRELQLAQYQASASLPQDVNDLQSENDTINQTPSREEERLVMSNTNVMTALEKTVQLEVGTPLPFRGPCFPGQPSILCREKDRTCRTSKPPRVESVRFQRAMYRIWLMSVLYGPRRFVPRGSFSDEDSHNRESDLDESWKDQKTFLRQFSSQELFQIRRLALSRMLRMGIHRGKKLIF